MHVVHRTLPDAQNGPMHAENLRSKESERPPAPLNELGGERCFSRKRRAALYSTTEGSESRTDTAPREGATPDRCPPPLTSQQGGAEEAARAIVEARANMASRPTKHAEVEESD